MRYKVKTQDCHLIVKVKTSWGEDIDERALETFARMHLQGFMKPMVIKRNAVEYTGPIGISLYERLQSPLSKHDFLFIMEQIVAAIQNLQSNDLSLNRVVLDLNNVFINVVTKEVQFLYIPSSEAVENPGLVAFIESIIYSTRPEGKADAEFISRFNYFLKGQKVLDLEIVEQYIAMEDPSVVATIKKQNIGQRGFVIQTPDYHHDHYDGNGMHRMLWPAGEETEALRENDAENYPVADDQDETCLLTENPHNNKAVIVNGGFERKAIEPVPEMQDSYDNEETTLLYEPPHNADATDPLNPFDAESNGTVLLKDMWAVHHPSLLRIWNQERVSIDKPVFRIGKEKRYVDYCVTNNNTVSRNHANIVTRGNRYFVIDLNSRNHTYVNGKVIAAQCETELRDGDRLRLANEEFTFHI